MAKVTVLMPTYNVEPYVREAIESVLRQTYTDFELLVIDDCSNDNTVEVAMSVADPRIRVVRNERNLGLAENLNRGLSMIDSEYVARMDGDDIAMPYWLEREVAILDGNPEIGVCGGGGERFGAVVSTIRFPENHNDIAVGMLFGCKIIVPTFRMRLYHNGLRYRSEAFPAEDYRFWADAMEMTQLHNIAESLFHYRMHASQICTSQRQEQQKKVVEVQTLLLQRLSNKLTSNDINYFVGPFGRNIDSKTDLKQRRTFIQCLLDLNRENRAFDPEALERGLLFHLQQTLYYSITERWFAGGYNLAAYSRYLFSGLALHTGWHYESRFLAKSILHRSE